MQAHHVAAAACTLCVCAAQALRLDMQKRLHEASFAAHVVMCCQPGQCPDVLQLQPRKIIACSAAMCCDAMSAFTL
jgi:hypothetical protein